MVRVSYYDYDNISSNLIRVSDNIEINYFYVYIILIIYYYSIDKSNYNNLNNEFFNIFIPYRNIRFRFK